MLIQRSSRYLRMPRTAVGWAAVAGVALAAVGLGFLLSGRSGNGGTALPMARAVPAVRERPYPATGGHTPGTTLVATVRVTAPKYASPGRREAGWVPSDWWGRPSVLPVIATRPGWVRVRLAQRPNGSAAWLPASNVTLGSTPFRIVINVAAMHLSLYSDGRLVFSTPAGVGAVNDPTPTGEYFVAFEESPPRPNPGYGPFIMVTSAHSPDIADWEGSGDAIIGIHGPLGSGAEIGSTGARISHGCVRLHDQALEQLSGIPAGTPIDIIR